MFLPKSSGPTHCYPQGTTTQNTLPVAAPLHRSAHPGSRHPAPPPPGPSLTFPALISPSVPWTPACLVAQSCPTLCNPMDCSPPGSPVHGILPARILEGLPCSPPGDLPDPCIEPTSPTLQVDSLPSETPGGPTPEPVPINLAPGRIIHFFALQIYCSKLHLVSPNRLIPR